MPTSSQAATARIAEELNSQYVLGYSSPKSTDGKFHSIRVSMRDSEHPGAGPQRLRRDPGEEDALKRIGAAPGVTRDPLALLDSADTRQQRGRSSQNESPIPISTLRVPATDVGRPKLLDVSVPL